MTAIFLQFYHMASQAYSQNAQFSPLIGARIETLEIKRLNNNEAYESPFSSVCCWAAAQSPFGYQHPPGAIVDSLI